MTATFSTKLAAPVDYMNTHGKWAAAFETWMNRDGQTHKMASCVSAAMFDTAADAEEAGKRALVVLEATGKFPNMCEKF